MIYRDHKRLFLCGTSLLAALGLGWLVSYSLCNRESQRLAENFKERLADASGIRIACWHGPLNGGVFLLEISKDGSGTYLALGRRNDAELATWTKLQFDLGSDAFRAVADDRILQCILLNDKNPNQEVLPAGAFVTTSHPRWWLIQVSRGSVTQEVVYNDNDGQPADELVHFIYNAANLPAAFKRATPTTLNASQASIIARVSGSEPAD